MRPVSRYQVRRKMLVVAVTPKPENVRRSSEPRRFEVLERFEPDRLIVAASEADIYLMFDRPVQSDRPGHRVETLVLGETGYLEDGVTPSIGGNKHRNHADYDFASKPFPSFLKHKYFIEFSIMLFLFQLLLLCLVFLLNRSSAQKNIHSKNGCKMIGPA